jgi:hypothetical protein
MNYERLSKLIEQVRTESALMLTDARTKHKSTESAVNALIETEKFLRDVRGACDGVTGEIKETLAEIYAETGNKSFTVDAGMTYITDETESVSYDNTAIETLCISDPALAARLSPFRKINKRRGSIVIR